jgi:hypothetical protein
MKKRGEVTTPEIIFWITLIASFAVIVFFFFRLDLKSNSVPEICKNSVDLRSNPISSELAPLNCKTQYTCISKDGSCESMNKPEIKKAKTKDDVYKILADQMADCWWMFGEGKEEYIRREFDKNNYCSIVIK